MICCIIGKGSIGRRHGEILKNLHVKVLFLRRNPSKSETNEISFNYKYIRKINFFIVSNPSSLHLKTIKKIIKFKKPILVEKPFITQLKLEKDIKKYKKIFILYQMRFDPRIKFLKKKIKNEKIKKGSFIWKTFLPDWHKNENYKKSYASKKILGGGVIFTMSHEIDTAINLMGKVKSVYATKNKNKFKIDVEDNINLKLDHYGNFSSNLKLSFASKKNIRRFNIKTNNNSFKWNFFDNKIFTKNSFYKFKLKNDEIYVKQMRSLLLTLKSKKYKNSEIHIDKILHTQNVINACIKSLKKKEIIKLD